MVSPLSTDKKFHIDEVDEQKLLMQTKCQLKSYVCLISIQALRKKIFDENTL